MRWLGVPSSLADGNPHTHRTTVGRLLIQVPNHAADPWTTQVWTVQVNWKKSAYMSAPTQVRPVLFKDWLYLLSARTRAPHNNTEMNNYNLHFTVKKQPQRGEATYLQSYYNQVG